MNKILESIKFVADNSKHVSINAKEIDNAAKKYVPSKTVNNIFPNKKLSDKERVSLLVVANSLNFSYWGEPKWTIEYENKKYDGYYGMMFSLYKAIDEKIPILDASYLRKLSRKELANILRGNTQIPLFNERLKIFNEIGKNTNKYFGGDFSKIIKKASKDSSRLVELIVKTFPSFDDTSEYKGKKVFFYKRAQLLVYDMYRNFDGKGPGAFSNINELTAFADYKIPQILRDMNILVYDKKLADKVDKRIHIKKDSPEEIEIRANSVWAVELLKQEISKKYPDILSSDIDSYLWLSSQNNAAKKPYHLTRTITY